MMRSICAYFVTISDKGFTDENTVNPKRSHLILPLNAFRPLVIRRAPVSVPRVCICWRAIRTASLADPIGLSQQSYPDFPVN